MTPEQRHNLARLIAPRHVAVIGGNDAAIAAEQCAAMGFEGPVWGVNPRRDELAGRPCFASVEALPEAPDAVFLAVPRGAAVETMAALAHRGAGGAVCYTAGFGELGAEGARLERELVEAAGDMALVGPNCYGLLNFVQGAALWPFAFGGKRVPRGVAIVTQSGMLGSNITMNRRSVPLAYVISAGNQAMLGIEDYLEVLVGDPAVAAIGLHVEGLRDVPRFAEAAIRALQAGVPIVALKSGTSEMGARLTVSHTGSLSGSDAAYQALFERLGIIRVDSPVMLLETLKLLSLAGVPEGRRLAAFTASGGDATLLADYAEELGLSFPQPSPAVAKEIARRLPEVATVSNPLDYTTPLWGHEAELTDLFGAALREGYDAALIVQDYPHPDIEFGKDSYLADSRAFIAATRAAGLPAAVVSGLPENIDRASREMIAAGGVAPLQGIKEAMIAVALAAAHGERRAQVAAEGGAGRLALPPPPPPAAGEAVLLDEWQGKQRLAAAGIPVPPGKLTNAADAPAAAEALGFPVAVKLVSADLPHKSEAGALRLGLKSAAEVAEAVAAIGGRGRRGGRRHRRVRRPPRARGRARHLPGGAHGGRSGRRAAGRCSPGRPVRAGHGARQRRHAGRADPRLAGAAVADRSAQRDAGAGRAQGVEAARRLARPSAGRHGGGRRGRARPGALRGGRARHPRRAGRQPAHGPAGGRGRGRRRRAAARARQRLNQAGCSHEFDDIGY